MKRLNKKKEEKTLNDFDSELNKIQSKIEPTATNPIPSDVDRGKLWGETIDRLVTGVTTKSYHHLKELVNFSGYDRYPVQRWFKYREGFSVDLVKEFIQGINGKVLDPFCGSGTTLLAAKELGLSSVGLDINPLAALISKVKLEQYTLAEIEQIKELTKQVLRIGIRSSTNTPPELKIINKVFNIEILQTLLKIERKIDSITDMKLRDFLRVGWLAILESVSNVKKEGNGIKYKFVKRTKDGYIQTSQEKWENQNFGIDKPRFVINTLKNKYSEMIQDLRKQKPNPPLSRVYCDSAINLSSYIKTDNIATCIFSPPYANSFDYFEIFKVELWMGRFVKNYQELLSLRKGAMRSNFNTSDIGTSKTNVKISPLEEILKLITNDNWDKRTKDMLRGYFEDIYLTLTRIFEVLKPGGKCIIIVGNSAYSGVLIPTDLLVSYIGKEVGFISPELNVIRSLTTSSQQKLKLGRMKAFLRESVVILQKPYETKEIKVDEIPTNEKIERYQKFIITSNNVSYLTHAIHKFPAKFIPQIPRWAIKQYGLGKTGVVLDPFCGSGTSLIEASLLGINSYGIDIDPLARLISKVKTTFIDPVLLEKTSRRVLLQIEEEKGMSFIPTIDNLSHWFNNDAIRKLSIIRGVIELYRDQKDLYDFLIVTFSSIIRRVSNADNESQKTYVSHTMIKTPEDPFEVFKKNIGSYSQRLIDAGRFMQPNAKATVLTDVTDSRNLAEYWLNNIKDRVSVAITSPPYIKAVDYIYNQMVEHFWIGDLFGTQTQRSQNEMESRYMGTKHIPSKLYAQKLKTGYNGVDEIADKVFDKNRKFAYILSNFFIDMAKNLKEVQKILKSDGHYVVVIGSNNIAGISVPSYELISEIAVDSGYRISNLFSYKIRNHYMRFPRKGRGGLIDEDWIVDLVKSE